MQISDEQHPLENEVGNSDRKMLRQMKAQIVMNGIEKLHSHAI